MKQQQPFRGLGLVLILVIMLIVASMFPRQNEKISNQEYMKAIEDGSVVAATVKQNQQTPTGQVVLIISDGSTEQLLISMERTNDYERKSDESQENRKL